MNNMAEIPSVVVSPAGNDLDDILNVPDEIPNVPDEEGDTRSSIGSSENRDLDILENVKKCAESLYPPHVITEYLRIFQCEPTNPVMKDIPEISNFVFDLADTNNIVKLDMLKNVRTIAMLSTKYYDKVPALEHVVNDYLLPLTIKNITESDPDIMIAAQTALLGLLEQGSITNFQAEIQVCPTILAATKMSSSDHDVHFITFMSHMVPLLGRDTTERVFLERYVELCESKDFVIRKSSALNIGNFCNVVGKNTFDNKLLPCYIKLCNDDNWRVRKACAEVIMSISYVCSSVQRQTILAPVFVKLIDDPSRWVQTSAFQVLGPFISTFADANISNIYYNNVDKLDVENRNETIFYNPFVKEDPGLDIDYMDLPDDYMSGYSYAIRKGGKPTQLYHNISFDNISFDNSSTDVDPLNDILKYGGSYANTSTKSMSLENDKDIDVNKYKMENNPLYNHSYYEMKLNEREANSLQNDLKNSEDFNREQTYADEDFGHVQNAYRESKTSKVDDVGAEVEPLINDLILPTTNVNGNNENEQNYLGNNVECIKQDKGDSNEIDKSNNTEFFVLRNEDENNENHVADSENNVEPKTEQISDNNVIEVLSNLTNSSLNITDESRTHNNENVDANCNRDQDVVQGDDLQSYNSYYYWFVDPNLPLDPTLVNSCKYGAKKERISYFAPYEDTLSPLMGNGDMAKEKKLIYQQDVVPQILVDHFISMIRPDLAQRVDGEIALYCAYSLPAVALTLGSKNWNVLKDTTELLATYAQHKVRKTIASSLHDLALILGPDLASDSLIPIFDSFIVDVDEVRIGILKNLAHFLRLIPPEKRPFCLPRLNKFLLVDNELNWRHKYELAEQLLLATPLFNPIDSARYIGRIGQMLLGDKVAAVREITIKLMSELIRYISPIHHITQGILVRLAEGFGHSKNWKRRQTYATLCSELLTNDSLSMEQYSTDVLPHFMDLSWDPVANVRLVVAKIISKDLVSNKYYADPSNQYVDILQSIVRRLQNDNDRDVKFAATAIADDTAPTFF